MTDGADAIAFAHAWVNAWNRRDVEAVLRHFHDDAVFTSPVAKQIGFAVDGVVRGKHALRRYWTAALLQNPDLHFDLNAVYQGTDTVAIAFRNQKGIERVEVLTFEDGLIIRGHGTFAVLPTAPGAPQPVTPVGPAP